ncbi:putative PDDEXK endonuclease [Burkholderia lata]|uniref:Holliday junction resolvase n=1 Tax=Burkholderia lata (strain ATCC 17760 / DSM 23089 / LMG 22485 / NCIMB 9086 / R18194 / 383) TaxID=482957 RepID=A0A6P2GU75_BURL3|nr:hypothetical protein [Burkholderia lata]VWB07761.1 hypothetical protein BLA6863_00184 [Burkholderia lata]
MGMKSRMKGKVGEREIAAIVRDLTGWDVKRKVRQLDGEADLEGIPLFSVEVKRHATATRAEVAAWWEQARNQGMAESKIPVLFYRKDRDDWRAVWSAALMIGGSDWPEYGLTIEGSIEVWAAAARDLANTTREALKECCDVSKQKIA